MQSSLPAICLTLALSLGTITGVETATAAGKSTSVTSAWFSLNIPYDFVKRALIKDGWVAAKFSLPCGINCTGLRDKGWLETEGCADTGLGQCVFVFHGKNSDDAQKTELDCPFDQIRVHTIGDEYIFRGISCSESIDAELVHSHNA